MKVGGLSRQVNTGEATLWLVGVLNIFTKSP